MTITIQINNKQADNVKYIVSKNRLNIKIISIEAMPGRYPEGEPNTEVIFQLLSDNLSEVFFLGFYLGKEKLPFNL